MLSCKADWAPTENRYLFMLVTKEICDQLSDVEIVKKTLVHLDFFSCLYDRYEPALLRYIQRIASTNRQESEDILQEAFIKIWKPLHDFDQSPTAFPAAGEKFQTISIKNLS